MPVSTRVVAVVAVLAVVAGAAVTLSGRLEKPLLQSPRSDRGTPLAEAAGAAPVAAQSPRAPALPGSQPLEPALRQVAMRLDLHVQVDPGIAGDLVGGPGPAERTEDYLQRLLRPYDTFYLHSADEGLPARATAIWVLPRGAAHRQPPLAMDSAADALDLQSQLHSADATTRLAGYERLLDRQGVDGTETLQQALNDPSDEVRSQSLFAATVAGVPIPTEQLQSLVVNDPSPAVRRAVLHAATDRPDSGAIAAYALSDLDPEVRGIAQALVHRGSADTNSGAAEFGPQQPDVSSIAP